MTSTQMLVYRYGLLPPTEGGEIVTDQMSRAHRYANVLVEIERRRRANLAAVLGCSAEDALWSAARLTEWRAHATIEQVAALEAVTPGAHAEARAARAACGVYWGTYLLVEQAHDQIRRARDLPRFRRWTGDGAIGVQCQGGLLAADLLAGTDTRLAIDRTPQPVPGRGGKARPRVRVRVGSTGRDPIWAEWPVILHRPLPEGAVVKTAKVVRRREAAHDTWSLHLTIEIPAPVATAPEGAVAVDLSWRRDDGQQRACGWTDGWHAGDHYLDPAVIGMLAKASDLRAIRDKARDQIHAALLAWRATATLPPAHTERLATLARWESPARFAALARWWREQRIDGDHAIVEALEAWRRHDKHLWLWEHHARRKAIARRRDQYRVFAAQLATRYQTLVIERLDLRSVAMIETSDDRQPGKHQGRVQRTQTAPSELRAALVQAFTRRGGEVVSVRAGAGAGAHLAAYRERRDVEPRVEGARSNRFKALREKKAARQAARIDQEGGARA